MTLPSSGGEMERSRPLWDRCRCWPRSEARCNYDGWLPWLQAVRQLNRLRKR